MSETRRGVSKRISQPPRALDNGGATRKSKANINTEDIDTGTRVRAIFSSALFGHGEA